MQDNGDRKANGLLAIVTTAIWTFPAEARLIAARKIIAFCTTVERDALRDLGGVEPATSSELEPRR
jgi:hypothetical protein